jgi:WD repeat-containing protein 61
VVTGSQDENVTLWNIDAETGAPKAQLIIPHHTLGAVGIATGVEGGMLAVSCMDSNVRLWTKEGESLGTFNAGPVEAWAVAIDPASGTLVAGGASGVIHMWDVEKGEEVGSVNTKAGFITSLAFSDDGARLAAGNKDGGVTLVNVRAGTVLSRVDGHAKPVRSVAFGPGGRSLYSCGDDGRVVVMDSSSLEGGALVSSFAFLAHKCWALSLAVSPDGAKLATGAMDGRVTLWDVERREAIQTFDGHEEGVWSVAFRSDGKQLVSGGEDGKLVAYAIAV